jgi:hypothetical protein
MFSRQAFRARALPKRNGNNEYGWRSAGWPEGEASTPSSICAATLRLCLPIEHAPRRRSI